MKSRIFHKYPVFFRMFSLFLSASLFLGACTPSNPFHIYPNASKSDQAIVNILDINCAQGILYKLGKTGETVSIKANSYASLDDVETVKSWYKQQLSTWNEGTSCGNVTVFTFPQGCSTDSQNCTQLVAISASSDGTWIFTAKPK
jgi:hypothetical protein